MRKGLIVVLLAAALEVAWLLGGLELLRSAPGPSLVGQVGQAVTQAKALQAAMRDLGDTTAAPRPAPPGDPDRNPFTLPPGVRLLGQPADPATVLAPAGGGPSANKEPAPPPAPPRRELGGIMVSGRERLAIIDGTLVRSGDELDGDRIADINPDRVVLVRDGTRRTLRLADPLVTP